MRFGGVVALDDVTFEVARGEICGLIGPNGAGKTTLFNCISRLYRPHAGAIRFDGRPLAGASQARDRRARHRAHVPEPRAVRHHDRRAKTSWSARMRWRGAAFSQTRSRCRSRGARGAAARRAGEALIEEFGLAAVADRPVGELPFGVPQAGRARARARDRPEAAAARRAGRRPQPRGGRRAGRGDPGDPRPARRRDPARRASHEPRHARFRPGGRARFRPRDRRRRARRGASATRTSCAPISGARRERPILEVNGLKALLRPDRRRCSASISRSRRAA